MGDSDRARSALTGVPHVEIDIVGRGRRCHRLSRPTMSLSTGRAPARAPTGAARRAARPGARTVKSAWDDHFAGRSGAPGLRPTARAALGQGPRGQHRDREAPSSQARRRTGRRSPRPVGITHPVTGQDAAPRWNHSSRRSESRLACRARGAPTRSFRGAHGSRTGAGCCRWARGAGPVPVGCRCAPESDHPAQL